VITDGLEMFHPINSPVTQHVMEINLNVTKMAIGYALINTMKSQDKPSKTIIAYSRVMMDMYQNTKLKLLAISVLVHIKPIVNQDV